MVGEPCRDLGMAAGSSLAKRRRAPAKRPALARTSVVAAPSCLVCRLGAAAPFVPSRGQITCAHQVLLCMVRTALRGSAARNLPHGLQGGGTLDATTRGVRLTRRAQRRPVVLQCCWGKASRSLPLPAQLPPPLPELEATPECHAMTRVGQEECSGRCPGITQEEGSRWDPTRPVG